MMRPEELDRLFKEAVIKIANDNELREAIIKISQNTSSLPAIIENAVERLRKAIRSFE